MLKLEALLLVAGLLTVTAAPGRCAETATADDTAQFLAGLAPAPDSPLTALTTDPLWQRHARHFDSLFARKDSISLAKIREFSRRQLPNKRDTMLYMFSGPDFLYATSFFPNASTYVLSGLEPTGDIPQLTTLRRPAIDSALQNLEGSLNSLLSISFFKTNDMKSQLNVGPVYGTLPVLYVFLARTGKTIHHVSLVTLDEEGNVAASDQSGSAKGAIGGTPQYRAKGVKIVFSDTNHSNQTLYYFSTDLSDNGVRKSGFLEFCNKFGASDSLIKSASYLLHGDRFAKVRGFLLDHSTMILQDDSGIPVAYFNFTKWRLQPFGRYVGPISLFGRRYQAQLTQLFHTGNSIALDFGIGYRWRRDESNLLLAVKKDAN